MSPKMPSIKFRWNVVGPVLAVLFALSVASNAFQYFYVIKPLSAQVADAGQNSLSLWSIKKTPEKYMGERDVPLMLVNVEESAIPAPNGIIYTAKVQDPYGYEVSFYIPYALVDMYKSRIGRNTMFHLNGSISPYPLHGIAPGEPAFSVLVNEQRSDGMWNTITIELIPKLQ